MHESFSLADRLVVAGYAAALLAFALWRTQRRRGDSVAAYLVAGRAVTLPGFVANLVASWYGGILGVSEYAYRYGVSNWLVFGVPYYLGALIFALFVAPRARSSRALTIPDRLQAAYGRPAGVLSAVIVLGMTIPGAYVLMAGTLANEILGTPAVVGIVLVTLLSCAYLFFGGMRAIVAADRFYILLMYGSFAFMVCWLAIHYGGMGFLRRNLPAQQFTWNGGRPAQAVLVWYVIALATLIEPTFYEACFSADRPRTARAGILISIVFWALFDFMTTATGMYARALLPPLADPARAFPLLAERVLPPAFCGLFFAGMLATVMSTVDSYLFISAQTLGHDLGWRLHGGEHPQAGEPPQDRVGRDASTARTRIALGIVALVAIAIALSGLTIIELWHHLGSIGTPALLVPLVASFDNRLRPSPRAAVTSIVLAGLVAAAWLAGAQGDRYWLGLEPIFPALAVSLCVWAGNLLARRARARS